MRNKLSEGAQGLQLDDLFAYSRDAVWLANRAFFNPTMVGLLYFVSFIGLYDALKISDLGG